MSHLGGQRWSVVEQSSDYTLNDWDYIVAVDTAAGDVTLTLPPASDSAAHVVKRRIGPNALIVVPSGGDTIDGGTEYRTTRDGGTFLFIASGGDWRLAWASSPQIGMMWRGRWEAQEYEPGDVVFDSDWTMVALARTNERAAPQPIGQPLYISGLPDNPTWEDRVSTGAVSQIVGQRYTIGQSGYLLSVRVFIPFDPGADQRYSIWVRENPGQANEKLTQIASLPVGTSEGWASISLGREVLRSGTIVDVLMVIHSEAPPPTTWSAFYDYKQSNGSPGSGEIYHQNNLTEMRIHHDDEDDIDRQAQLEALGVGDTIAAAGITWEITAVDPRGSHIRFDVVPATRASEDSYTFQFTEAGSADLEFDRIVGHYDPAGSHPYKDNVQGFEGATLATLAFDENAYGVDIEVQEAYVSADWDAVAFNA